MILRIARLPGRPAGEKKVARETAVAPILAVLLGLVLAPVFAVHFALATQRSEPAVAVPAVSAPSVLQGASTEAPRAPGS